jgi:hypothetical protein
MPNNAVQAAAHRRIEAHQRRRTLMQRSDWVCWGYQILLCLRPNRHAGSAAAGREGWSLRDGMSGCRRTISHSSRNAWSAPGQGYETWCASRGCLCRALVRCYQSAGSQLLCRVMASAAQRTYPLRLHFRRRVQAGVRKAKTARCSHGDDSTQLTDWGADPVRQALTWPASMLQGGRLYSLRTLVWSFAAAGVR